MISSDPSTPEALKYAMLGDDTSSNEEKLKKFTGRVPWSYLAPHFKSGNLFFVDPLLKLEDVGAAFSENRVQQVEQWLKTGDLVKIENLHAMQWAEKNDEFDALVVSPFVLCRPVAE